jgi:hypothetical protein
LSSSKAGWSSCFHLPDSPRSVSVKSPLRVTFVLSVGDDDILVDWFDGTRVEELCSVSVVVLLVYKFAVVASAGCTIV